MPIDVVIRKQTGAITLSGTIPLKNGTYRVQRKAKSNSVALAREEAALLEAEILRTDWHGERRDAHVFDEAIVKYMEAKPRSAVTAAYVERLRKEIGGDTPLSMIDQDMITRLRREHQEAAAAAGTTYKESTLLRNVIAPLRAILILAAKRKLCARPEFDTPTIVEGRTQFFLPREAEQMILAAPRHLKPFITFLLCTGARMSEALYLDWRDVDLIDGKVILWADETKAKKRRNIFLPPRAIAALDALPHREGAVFRRASGKPYKDNDRAWGGQICQTWHRVRVRAGLSNVELTPHITRHTWATWHYALHRDPIKLKEEGGWAKLDLVTRYAHLMPGGHVEAIRDFLGLDGANREQTSSLRSQA
jgi:integrase